MGAGAAIESICQGWRDRTGALESPKNRIRDVKFEAGTWAITYELTERQTDRVSKAGKVLAAK